MEVRTLDGATNPGGGAWIVIEQEHGLFAIEGKAGNGVQRSFRSRGIHSSELAIKATVALADLLSISRLYVRERQDRQRV